MFVSRKQSSQDARAVDGLMIQVVYCYLPAEVGTAEVTTCVIPYTLRCQDLHNLQYATIPNRYVTVKLKRQNQQSRQQNSERHAQYVGYFFHLYVGLHWSGWLYVRRMPPRGYLQFFATLSPQSTCHRSRPGPTLAPWCTGGFPACPGAESTRKDPRPEEAKKNDVQNKTNLYIVI